MKLHCGCRHLTCFIVSIVLSGAFSNVIPRKEDKKEVPILVSWGGEVKMELREKPPKTIYIKDSDAWEALWKAWRPTEQIPPVNFDKAVVLVVAGENPNYVGVTPVVDVDGDLTMSTRYTLIGYINPSEFRYLFALVSRAGVKSINGDVLGPKRPQGDELNGPE